MGMVERGVVRGIMLANKVGVGAIVIETAADDLFYLTLV